MGYVFSSADIYIYIHSAQKLRDHLFFPLKNVSILNGHNIGDERRTEMKKKAIWSRLGDFLSPFVRSLKFEIMLHNNQSDTFFHVVGWFSLIDFDQIFFFIDRIKITRKLIF